MRWLEERRQRRHAALLQALGEKECGWFTLDLAKYLDRHVATLHADLAHLENVGLVKSWWQDGPYPRRRLYARSKP
jgi:predicted transcriptional regulator